MKTYVRKTQDVYNLLANYGYGHGWEIVCAELTRKEIKERLKEYRINEGGNYKIEKKREVKNVIKN